MFVFGKNENKSELKIFYTTYSIVNKKMHTTLNACNMTLSGATKFICQMNKFVDCARRFINIQKAIQCTELYIRTYDSLHKY